MVNSSPSTEITARLPDGDRKKLSASALTVRVSRLFSRSSEVTSILTSTGPPLLRSSFQRPKFSS